MAKSFIIQAKSGKYRVQMRGALQGITSEKKLRIALQRTVDGFKQKEGWQAYGERCQQLLDERDYFALHTLFGMFGNSKRIE